MIINLSVNASFKKRKDKPDEEIIFYEPSFA